MPRLVRVITRLNAGGPARQIAAMTPHLGELGWETHVVCGPPPPDEGSLEDLVVDAGARIHRIENLVRPLQWRRDRRAAREIRAALGELRPDLVHTHMAKAGWLGRKAALSLGGVPLVHTFHGHLLHGYFSPLVRRIYTGFERRISHRTDRLVCVSGATLDDLLAEKIVPPDRSGVIRPGLDLGPFEHIQRGAFEGAGTCTLLFLGRLVPVKHPERFVRLVAQLVQSGHDVRGRMIGDGPEREALEAQARELGLDQRLRIEGMRRDMVAVFESSDVLVCTSSNEGLPMAMLEAFAAGRPVVSTDVGGIDEIVIPERTGILVTEDEQEMKAAIERLLEHPAEARAMGERGRTRVRDLHSGHRLAKEHHTLYTSILPGGA